MANLALTFDVLARDNASKTFRDVGNAAEQAGKKGQRFGEQFSGGLKLFAGALAGAGIVQGLKSVITASSDAEQSIGGVQAVFKDYATGVIRDSKAADRALGLSANSYRELSTVIGSQLKNAGVPLQNLGKQTEDVIQTGADLAAQFGGSTQDAVEALSAAFRGETDPIERYGISLTAAAVGAKAVQLGLSDSKTDLSQNAKLMATLAIVTEQGADAQGAFARESDTAAGRAQRASAQWDNLKVTIGDELLPAWSSLVDVLGTRVIPALGDVVGVVGDAVGFFTDLPAPIQAGAIAAGAWAIAGGRIMDILRPMGGLLSGLRGSWQTFGQALGYARQNGDGLGTVLRSVGQYAGGQTLTAIKNLGRAIGPELAVAAGAFLITNIIDGFKELAGASSEAEAAAEGLAQALTLTDQAADQRAVRQAIQDTDGLVEALEHVGVSSQDAINGLLGQEDAQRRVTGALQEWLNLNPGGIHDREAVAAKAALDAYNALAGGYGTAAGNARYFADSAEQSGTAAADAAPAVDNLTTQLEGTADAADAAKKQTDLFKTSLDVLTGAHVSIIEVESAFYDALASAGNALENTTGEVLTQSGALNLQTEAGRKVSDSLINLKDRANDFIGTMISQGATTDAVRAKDNQLRQSFYNTALQMTGSKEAAQKLTDSIYGIPERRTTTITADTGPARAAINGLVNDYRGYTINLGLSANFNRFAAAAGGVLPGFTPGRDVHRFMSASGMQLDLSGGEAIMRPEWTQAVGSNFVGRMNKLARIGGTAAVRSAMGFAPGGIVPADWLGGMLFRTGIDAGALATARSGMRNYASQFSGSVAPGAPAATGGNQAIVQSLAASMYGWTGAQWNALYALIMKESGFRNTAQNPTSTAYGMFQFLDSTWAGYGVGKTSDPRLQTVAGLRYIASKYGSPSSALNFHLAHNWYDEGGWLQPGYTLAYNGTGKPERVVGPNDSSGLTGMEITGRLEVGGDGFAHIVDGRIVEAFAHVNRRGRYNG